MTAFPANPSMARRVPPSRTLRAGVAGGLKAVLDGGTRRAKTHSGRDEETAPFSRTKKLRYQHAKSLLHNLTDTTLAGRLWGGF